MSGGSYEYLYAASGADLFAKIDMLEAMLDRLQGLNYASGPRNATEFLLADVLLCEKRLNQSMHMLRGVWLAVELWDSGDVNESAVMAAVQKYMDSLPSPNGMGNGEHTEA